MAGDAALRRGLRRVRHSRAWPGRLGGDGAGLGERPTHRPDEHGDGTNTAKRRPGASAAKGGGSRTRMRWVSSEEDDAALG